MVLSTAAVQIQQPGVLALVLVLALDDSCLSCSYTTASARQPPSACCYHLHGVLAVWEDGSDAVWLLGSKTASAPASTIASRPLGRGPKSF
jgi:hypothetical protein